MGITITWDRNSVARADDGGDLFMETEESLEIDALGDVTYSWSGNQTKRPVERGAPTSDHWQRNLDTVSLRCLHTDTPGFRGGKARLQTATGANNKNLQYGEIIGAETTSRTASMLDALHSLAQSGVPLTITGLKYPVNEFRLISVSAPVRSGQDGLLEFTLDMEEIRVVTVQTVDTPAPRVERGRRRRDTGRNQGSETTTPSGVTTRNQPVGENRSALASALDSLTGGSTINDAARTSVGRRSDS